MKRLKLSLSTLLSGLIINQHCLASSSKDLGQVAQEIAQPLVSVASLIHIICLVAGAGLIMSAFIRYMQHRRNPMEATLSSVAALFFTGVALIILAFIPIPFGNS